MIIISQVFIQQYCDWISEIGKTHPDIEFWTSNPATDLASHIKVRPLPQYRRDSVLTRLWSWLTCTLIIFVRLLFRPRKADVLLSTNPPLAPLAMLILHYLRGYRYYVIELDIYPQIAHVMGFLNKNSVIYQLWEAWHARALRRAVSVITLSDLMAQELADMIHPGECPIHVVHAWVDLDWLHPRTYEENWFAQKHFQIDDFVVLYSGNLGETHSVETLIEVAKLLRSHGKIRFLIIGWGAKFETIEQAIKTEELENILLFPRFPYEDLPYTLASADVGVVTLASGYERLSMPSKTYSLLAVGASILGIGKAPNGVSMLIEENNCGRNFESHETTQIAEWLLAQANNRALLHQAQQKSRELAEQEFSEKRGFHKLSTIIFNPDGVNNISTQQ